MAQFREPIGFILQYTAVFGEINAVVDQHNWLCLPRLGNDLLGIRILRHLITPFNAIMILEHGAYFLQPKGHNDI